jgi:hypothetical protein
VVAAPAGITETNVPIALHRSTGTVAERVPHAPTRRQSGSVFLEMLERCTARSMGIA